MQEYVKVYFIPDFGNGIGGLDCERCRDQWSYTHMGKAVKENKGA